MYFVRPERYSKCRKKKKIIYACHRVCNYTTEKPNKDLSQHSHCFPLDYFLLRSQYLIGMPGREVLFWLY